MDIGGNIAATGVVMLLVSVVFCAIFNTQPKQIFIARAFAAGILISLVVIPVGTLIKIWT